jgi:hypothetical protein
MPVSDFQINSRARAVLARNWVDLQQVRFGSFRGTVRVSGQLSYLGERFSAAPDPAKLENIERELRQIPGLERVYFDLTNWRKDTAGRWECLEKPPTDFSVMEESSKSLELVSAKDPGQESHEEEK